MTVRRALQQIARDLHAAGRKFALVGGFAVSARSLPRTTRDVDVAVAVRDDADAEALVYELRGAGHELVGAVEQTATSRLATARLRAPGTTVLVDLLFASSGIETDVAARAEPLEVLRGVNMPVAVLSDLVAMKVPSRDDGRRPQDAIDLRALLTVARPQDVSAARSALAEVHARGFARGKRLGDELDRAIAELSP
jgi:hypothetical protein